MKLYVCKVRSTFVRSCVIIIATTEIDQGYILRRGVEQDILQLDVSMQYSAFDTMTQCVHQLLYDMPTSILNLLYTSCG